MRLIDADELLKQPLDKANYPSNYVREAPTVCDIDAIRKRIKYEANVLDTTKGFAYCSGWMDAFKFALDIIDEHTKGTDNG